VLRKRPDSGRHPSSFRTTPSCPRFLSPDGVLARALLYLPAKPKRGEKGESKMSMRIGTSSNMIQSSNNISETRIESKDTQQSTADQFQSPRDSVQPASNLGQAERAHDLKLGAAIKQSELQSASRVQIGKLADEGRQVDQANAANNNNGLLDPLGLRRPSGAATGTGLLDPLGNKEQTEGTTRATSGSAVAKDAEVRAPRGAHGPGARRLLHELHAPASAQTTVERHPDGTRDIHTRWETVARDGSRRQHDVTESVLLGEAPARGGRGHIQYSAVGGTDHGVETRLCYRNGQELERTREIIKNGTTVAVQQSQDRGTTWQDAIPDRSE
jgi:hypothetical protein